MGQTVKLIDEASRKIESWLGQVAGEMVGGTVAAGKCDEAGVYKLDLHVCL